MIAKGEIKFFMACHLLENIPLILIFRPANRIVTGFQVACRLRPFDHPHLQRFALGLLYIKLHLWILIQVSSSCRFHAVRVFKNTIEPIVTPPSSSLKPACLNVPLALAEESVVVGISFHWKAEKGRCPLPFVFPWLRIYCLLWKPIKPCGKN